MCNHRVLFTFINFLFLVFFSNLIADEYKDAKKAYDQGLKRAALHLLIVKLHDDNDHQDAITLFKKVVREVIDEHLKAASEYARKQKWNKAFNEYEKLSELNKKLVTIKPVEEIKIDGKKERRPINIPKIDIELKKRKLVNDAAEAHYQRGIEIMQSVVNSDEAVAEFDAANSFIKNYKDSYQLAAECLYRDAAYLLSIKNYKNAIEKLRLCQEYVPEYKETGKLIAKANGSATRRIAIMPFANKTGQIRFGDVGESLTAQTIAAIVRKSPEFLECVTRQYLENIMREQTLSQSGIIDLSTAPQIGKLTSTQAFVFGSVLSITVSFSPESRATGTSSKERWSVQQEQIITTMANWVMHTRACKVEITMNYQIVDAEKGTVVKSETIRQSFDDRIKWATYAGDYGALEADIKDHVTTNPKPLDSPEILANKAIETIAEELSTTIINHFQ